MFCLMSDHEDVKHSITALWHEASEIFCLTDGASSQSIFEARAGHLKKGSTQPTIPIWKAGSEIVYVIDLGSFPTTASAETVGRALDNAATQWNDREVGVTFRRAVANDDSAFVVRCAMGPADVLARAFFADANDRTLYVYALAFLRLCPDNMARVFLHELGHILGLRHEFAGTDWVERMYPSIQIAPDNPESVMNHFDDLSYAIRESDVVAVRSLYSLRHRSFVEGFLVVVVDPEMLGH